LVYLIQNKALYYPEQFQKNKVMIAEDYNDTKNLKVFI